MTRVRLTQNDLVVGVYRGAAGSPNPGWNLWWRGRYIWPRRRQKALEGVG